MRVRGDLYFLMCSSITLNFFTKSMYHFCSLKTLFKHSNWPLTKYSLAIPVSGKAMFSLKGNWITLKHVRRKSNRIFYQPEVWCPSSVIIMVIMTTIFLMHIVFYMTVQWGSFATPILEGTLKLKGQVTCPRPPSEAEEEWALQL